MKVLKFGGTSVGSAERIKNVATLINDGVPKIVVLSAMSGTTNSLVQICNKLYEEDKKGAAEIIDELENRYYGVCDELFEKEEYKSKITEIIKERFVAIRELTVDLFSEQKEKQMLINGELLSTNLFHQHLNEAGIKNALIPALSFMRIDKDEEPDNFYIKESIERELAKYPDTQLFVTQGYITRNAYGETDNLKRGGSDYSASIIGMVIEAEEIQIWTDIDGVHNNDPRFVENTKPVPQISFDEAAELAYFGAKILHPSSIVPAQIGKIPLWLKNTLEPEARGTLITDKTESGQIKAVAAKDGITAIKVKSGRMLLAYGFLRKVFEIFEENKTPIDMITTSEIAVSVTIDDEANIEKILKELNKLGTVEVDRNQSIVCIVGDFVVENKGVSKLVFDALEDIPVRMISYGGSRHNISVLVNSEDKKNALNALSKHLFA